MYYGNGSHSIVSDCNPMDCSPPGSSVHGILQAIIKYIPPIDHVVKQLLIVFFLFSFSIGYLQLLRNATKLPLLPQMYKITEMYQLYLNDEGKPCTITSHNIFWLPKSWGYKVTQQTKIQRVEILS